MAESAEPFAKFAIKFTQVTNPPKTAVILCSVLETEVEHFARDLTHIVHIAKLPQGLHDDPPRLRRELQSLVDQIESEHSPEVIALVYGLCSRGTEGVFTKTSRLVIPRAHDCITLLLGSKERYADYVRLHPGTYWYSPGWNRHHIPPGPERHRLLYEEYRDKYGEDNADYLMQMEQNWFTTYDRATYVDMGVGATEDDIRFTKGCAEWLKWNFDRQHGTPDLLKALLTGQWDEERFLVLEPGQTFSMTADERIIDIVDERLGRETGRITERESDERFGQETGRIDIARDPSADHD